MRVPAMIPPALLSVIRQEAGTAVAPAFRDLADRVRVVCAGDVEAVLLYGSCLRANDAAAGVVDLFVIVADYGRAPGGPVRRALNTCLPPNVYFLAHDGPPQVRCKYAVISLGDFEGGARTWLQPYLWARFAQPSRLLFARDSSVHDRVCATLAAAVVSFLRNVMPVMSGHTLRAPELWRQGLALTYGAELRPEGADRPDILASTDEAYCERVTSASSTAFADLALPVDGGAWRMIAPEPERRKCLSRWKLRALQGPVLSILRWVKGAFTFSGGVEYAAWKIERHTGVRIEITDRLRRHPLIYGWPVLWRLWRTGTLR